VRATIELAFLILIVGSLIPASASADVLGVDLNPAHWVVDGFKALLEWIFGDLEELAKNLVRLMLAVPLLTDTQQFPKLNKYFFYVRDGSFGILFLSFVWSTIRFWGAGFAGEGAGEALEGFKRTVLAAGMLLAFPTAFDLASRIINELTVALVVNPSVGHGLLATAGPFAAFVAITAVITTGGLALIVVLIGVVLMIGLFVVKVVIIALLAVLFVGAPICIALWPIEELGHLLRSCLGGILGCFAFPVTWALCFGVFAVLPADALFGGPSGGSISTTLLSPLVGLAALILAWKIPFVVMRQALNAGLMPRASRAMMAARGARLGGSVWGGIAGGAAAGATAGATVAAAPAAANPGPGFFSNGMPVPGPRV
jgi:uncharacterized membrane protein